MEIALNTNAIGIAPSSTPQKSFIINGLQPSQSFPSGLTQGDDLCASGEVCKSDQSDASKKGLALLAALTLSGKSGILPTTNTSTPTPTTPTHCNAIPFNSSNSTNNAITNNMNSSTTITDSAIITSSSNANISTTGLEATNLKHNNMKSLGSAIKLTTNFNSANSNKSVTGIATPATANISIGKHYFQIPSDILDDLASRFIINVPDMELSNLIRICFQIELAHWFYLDFFSAIEEKKLQPCGMKPFAMQIFQHIPFLREHLSSIDKILDDWKNYKLSVPTYGAILISEDLKFCLLVQSYFAKSSWSFPKGKVNENEDPVHCATREVYEETGYDITELIVPNDYIEAIINYQYTRLYIVRNVSLQTQFSPRTRNEIKCCDWFPIDSLPINKNDAISKTKLGINANSFFMIMPFVKRLKKWVNDNKRSGIETRCKFNGTTGNATTTTVCGQQTHTYKPLSTSPVVINSNGLNTKTSTNNSCKKNNKQQHQQQYNDDSIALKTGSTVGRSKRQRHKSMGDLDGVKLTNINNNNNNNPSGNICKATNNNRNNNNNNNNNIGKACFDHSASASFANNTANGISGSNHKRNSNGKCSGPNGVNNNTNGPPKRQLFHSQSQNGTQNLEKNGTTFDTGRREKTQQQYQQKNEKQLKAQKQQLQQAHLSATTRVRAKSQSDKISFQNQQQQLQQNNKINNNITNGNFNNNSNNNNIINTSGINSNSKQRLQKQQSMIITKINNNDNKTAGRSTPPPPPPSSLSSSQDTAVIVATTSTDDQLAKPKNEQNLKTQTAETADATCNNNAIISTPRPRPASISPPTVSEALSAPLKPSKMLFQRMASDTNLRLLKRSNWQQQKHEIQRRQRQYPLNQQPLKFTPNFNSWTNFSFTKNFIANVFC